MRTKELEVTDLGVDEEGRHSFIVKEIRVKSFTDEEKREIRQLHEKEYQIKEISEELSLNYQALLKFCRAEGLDTGYARAKRIEWAKGTSERAKGREKRKQRLLAYLKENGPTPRVLLEKEVEIHYITINKYIRELFDQTEKFRFAVGTGRGSKGGTKYGGSKIYNGLGINVMGVVLALRDDPRIIDFVARHIPFKVETGRDAQTLVMHLKKQLGYDRARQVVERLGYVYKRASHRAIKPKRRRKMALNEILSRLSDIGELEKNV